MLISTFTASLSLYEKEIGLTLSSLNGLLYYFYCGSPHMLSKADCEVVQGLLDYFEIGNDEETLVLHHFLIKACQDATDGVSPRNSAAHPSGDAAVAAVIEPM